jgi:hypothetical protein
MYIGTGGSQPLKNGQHDGIPTVIQEQNSILDYE